MSRNEPLYISPADWVRSQIRNGELVPGDLTPTERDLATEFAVSRATAARALELLVNEGLVTPGNSRAGRRVRDTRILPIRASHSEAMDHRTAAGVDAWVYDVHEAGRTPGQSIDVGVVKADTDVARWLDTPVDTPVAVRRRLRTLDGIASNRADTFYPMTIAQQIPEILDPSDVNQGVLALMSERGFATEHYIDALRWRPPTPEESQTLGIGQGVSVLIQARTGYMDAQPIHLTRTTWPGNTIELQYELPA